MTDRGLSTAIDVTLCLLLIGASVATVSTAVPPPDSAGPDITPVAVTIAASTNGSTGGTLLERIAAMALAHLRYEHPPPHVTQRSQHLNQTLYSLSPSIQVIALWRPYPDAPIAGTVRLGRTPPPTATVNTVRLTVPLSPGFSDARLTSIATTRGFEGLATALATATRRRVTQPCTTVTSLRDPDCMQSNTTLDDATLRRLSTTIERHLRTTYPTPNAVVAAVATDYVTVIIRRWDQ